MAKELLSYNFIKDKNSINSSINGFIDSPCVVVACSLSANLLLPVGKEEIWLTNHEFYSLCNKLFSKTGGSDVDAFTTDVTASAYKLIKVVETSDFNLCQESTQKIANTLIPAFTLFNEFMMRYKNINKGIYGEYVVGEYLSQFEDRWTILKNVNLPFNGDTSENDFIIFARGHIFTIEVKNYDKKTLDIASDGMVRETKIDGTYIPTTDNIIKQSARHTDILSSFLYKEFPDSKIDFDSVIHPVVVVSSDSADLQILNETNIPVIRPYLLRNEILKYSEVVIDKTLEEAIVSKIKSKSAEDKTFPFINPFFYSEKIGEKYIYEIYKELAEKIYTDIDSPISALKKRREEVLKNSYKRM